MTSSLFLKHIRRSPFHHSKMQILSSFLYHLIGCSLHLLYETEPNLALCSLKGIADTITNFNSKVCNWRIKCKFHTCKHAKLCAVRLLNFFVIIIKILYKRIINWMLCVWMWNCGKAPSTPNKYTEVSFETNLD